MNYIVFTDGSSRGNPGSGGWGSIIISDDNVTEIGGAERNTTNNKMELTAVICGLQKISKDFGSMQKSAEEFGIVRDDSKKENRQVKIYTDSSYVINGITKWIYGWKNNGWKTKTKDDVLNKDLWIKLDEVLNVVESKNVFWEYVGGHIGIVGNERCDIIATSFADGKDPALYDGTLSKYSIPNIADVSHDKSKVKAKKSDSSRSKAKAYSYVSSVGGEVKVHYSWAECEKRVKGAKGARYKKTLDAMNEAEIINEFGTH